MLSKLVCPIIEISKCASSSKCACFMHGGVCCARALHNSEYEYRVRRKTRFLGERISAVLQTAENAREDVEDRDGWNYIAWNGTIAVETTDKLAAATAMFTFLCALR